jgi:hypothetical protein
VVVTLGEGRQYGGPTEAARLKGAIDSGHTRDKVPGFDPGAAPLGTDEESAGAPPFLDGELHPSLEPAAAAEAAADPKGNDRSRYRAQEPLGPAIGTTPPGLHASFLPSTE